MDNSTPKLLMGPGPSNAHPRVLKAMSAPLIGHLDPDFLEVMADIKEMLQTIISNRESPDLCRLRSGKRRYGNLSG